MDDISYGKTAAFDEAKTNKPSRRTFLKLSATSGAGLAAGAAISLAPSIALADDYSATDSNRSIGGGNREFEAAAIKISSAKERYYETRALSKQKTNGDERRYRRENFYASFSKTLPHDQFGEVDPRAFRKLARAMRSGAKRDFDAIPLDPASTRKLADPQGALRFEIASLDSHATRIAPSHKFRSAELAGEQAEVYWQAITRDVPFINYTSDASIADAVSDLNAMSATPGSGGVASTTNLFRGETPGDLVGPYISQFLARPFNWGPVAVVQSYTKPVAGSDFMVDVGNWLNVQRGAVAETVGATETKYIYNNRALAEAVHNDALYQYYLHATLIMLGSVPGTDVNGASKFDPGNPYFNGSINNQGAFTSLGGPNIIDLVSKAGNLSLSGAWFQKWSAHRFLRPEALGGRIHFHKTGQRSYELHSDILNSEALNRVFNANGTYLLPMAFVEGSPTHPSYVAGHATVAGACVTVLKAFFNEDFVLSNNVQADATGDALITYNGDLTVGDELNKLANNVAIGRDAAGVHYRQDGIQGLIAGEQQGLALLAETTKTYNEADFDGFTVTKFDGTTVSIKNGNIS
ncbi:MAG: hypothetical protein ACJAYF_001998 [Arenicella sp.]|jgi:hypothetical protein